jgi:S-adenosylmethionine:tRNA ribosyltransferase-isomerase
MQRGDFHYDLPSELIAQSPPAERGGGRLLVLDGRTGGYEDRAFADLEKLVDSRDLLVFNDTRVLPARLRGRKASGGRVEVMLERIFAPREALVQIRASKAPKPGEMLVLDGGENVRVIAREGALFRIGFESDAQVWFEQHGKVPLPPYIDREPSVSDAERYQTVFARRPGAVAAPTAGLHFDEALLERLAARGVPMAFVTLHVGSGTFAPLRSEAVEANVLHAERVVVPAEVCAEVAGARERGGRVIAVGTTVVRALETAAAAGTLKPFDGESRLFIYPPFGFKVVDAMLTNFHLPESSLLMLVAAFAGVRNVLAAYRHAVEQRYRFFSYGDAMFITPEKSRDEI